MSPVHPHLGDYGEPPDGDYASYVERLLQSRAAPHVAPQPAAGAKAGLAVARAKPAVHRHLSAKWPLLLWVLFALLMWFAPALLPLVIGAVVVAGVGYGVWKSKRGPGANNH